MVAVVLTVTVESVVEIVILLVCVSVELGILELGIMELMELIELLIIALEDGGIALDEGGGLDEGGAVDEPPPPPSIRGARKGTTPCVMDGRASWMRGMAGTGATGLMFWRLGITWLGTADCAVTRGRRMVRARGWRLLRILRCSGLCRGGFAFPPSVCEI